MLGSLCCCFCILTGQCRHGSAQRAWAPCGADTSSPEARGGFPEQGLEEVRIPSGPGEGRSVEPAGSLGPSSTFHPFRPWSWTPSTATTGASRAVAPSLGRTCCLALTGCWMTFPAASSRPTEPLQMPLHHSLGCPFHPPALTKHHPWEDGNQPA